MSERKDKDDWMRGDWMRGDWIVTFSNRQFWPMDPRPAEVDPVDVAHALSNLCRYGGHCKRFYSVAEHSLLVSQVVPPEDALAGLLHDAPEAYLVDVPRPIKRQLLNYAAIEEGIWRAVALRFGLHPELPASVHAADDAVLLAERDVLFDPSLMPKWKVQGEAARVTIGCLEPGDAEFLFLKRLEELLAERHVTGAR